MKTTIAMIVVYMFASTVLFERASAMPDSLEGMGCITDAECEYEDKQGLTDAECEELGPDCEDLDERREVHAANVCLRMDSAQFCATKHPNVEVICATQDGRGCHAESRGPMDDEQDN